MRGAQNKMSVIIVFANGRDWLKANWVFRQLAQDVSNRYRNDGELCKALEVAQALGGLDLKNMGDDLRGRIIGGTQGCGAGHHQWGNRWVETARAEGTRNVLRGSIRTGGTD
jgi:hypothetical protein